MNIISPTQKGPSKVYLYDEETGGKGANEVCSIRWNNMKENWNMHEMNNIPHPSIHLAILDNCTGQNKSKLVFKFEAFLTFIAQNIFTIRIKLFLKPERK